jgi:hypothetical protein
MGDRARYREETMRIGRFGAGLALAVSAACGGNTVSPSDAGPDGGSVCDAYFDAYTTLLACYEAPLSAADRTLVLARFEQLCETQLNVPGSALTPSSLEACDEALRDFPCGGSVPAACATPTGARAAGASCFEGEQCVSAQCDTPGVGSSSSICGTCDATLAVGTPCGAGAADACAPGSVCDVTVTPPVCTPTTYGASGAPCDLYAALCDVGLVCSRATMTCAPPGAFGAACRVNTDCANGTACVASICAASSIGAPCTDAASCPVGTFCDAASRTCAAETWVSAGGVCGENAYCLVGTCPIPSGSTTGICPTIIADGQPCPADNTTTCDIYAECVDGVCAIPTASSCP